MGDGNLSDEQFAAGVALTQQLSGQFGIPPDPRHIIGHSDINGVGRNLDPGPYFSMADMIAAVAAQQGYMPAPTGYDSPYVAADYFAPFSWAP